MNKIKLNKKILYVVAVLILILIISLIFINTAKKDENPISTYSINQAGQMRNENEISEEVFDEYGNLTHYKYKKTLEDGTTYEKEYNINYTFDNQNKITRVAYDNNYIEIKYNNDNKISKLVNQIEYDNYKNKMEYNFTYDNEATTVSAKKYNIYENDEDNNLGENYITFENYTIKETTINNEKYVTCTVVNADLSTKEEYLYKIQDKEINYSNIVSLLNVYFDGFSSPNSYIINNNFTIFNIINPIFYDGILIYTRDLSAIYKNQFNCNYYYDKSDRILKSELIVNNSKFYDEIYFMYENANDKIYYRYSISAFKDSNGSTYNLLKEKIYSDDNHIIYKTETLENKTITEEQYKKELNKFEKYFERNKQDTSIYNQN